MKQEEIKEILKEQEKEDTLLFENPSYDSACIGITEDDRLIYSYEKMIQYLVETDNMTEEEAIEFIDFNTIRALPYFGNKAPIICYDTMFQN